LPTGQGHHWAKITVDFDVCESVVSLHIVVVRVVGYARTAGIMYCVRLRVKGVRCREERGYAMCVCVGGVWSGARRMGVSYHGGWWRKGGACTPSVECLVNCHESSLSLLHAGWIHLRIRAIASLYSPSTWLTDGRFTTTLLVCGHIGLMYIELVHKYLLTHLFIT
jgi:hypothetical protein